MSMFVRLPLLVPVFVLALGSSSACTNRSTLPEDEMSESDDASEGTVPSGDPGDQPTAPGEMFSPCEQSSECAPQEFCVFPQNESGYCTSACTTPNDPSNCDPPPGDQPSTCFDIGLDDGRWVCALDCASASCPRGMRCEPVATVGGERSICF